MNFFQIGGAAVLVAGLCMTGASSAAALSAKECSARYDAKKAAGTLDGMTYSAFRRAQCDADDPAQTQAQAIRAAPAAAQKTGADPVFPSAVSPKYASEGAGVARRHTCSDQFKANKATNANGGLKWLQKGGGYYSECNKHLKGS